MQNPLISKWIAAPLCAVLLLANATLFSQQAPAEGGRGERVKALRVAFITQQLDLTEQEAQSFWPLYNEFHEKLKGANEGTKKLLKTGVDNLSDAELEKLMDQELANEEKVIALKREYLQKFKKVLPLRKVARLPSVEKRFREELWQRVKENRKANGGGRGQGGNGGGGRGN